MIKGDTYCGYSYVPVQAGEMKLEGMCKKTNGLANFSLMRKGGKRMKSKKVLLLIIVMALIATIGICYATNGTKGETVQELRLYFSEDGKLLRVEPIDKKKYEEVKRIPNLYSENIGGGASVMFGSKSPVCTYWQTYETEGGYVRICLKWVDLTEGGGRIIK